METVGGVVGIVMGVAGPFIQMLLPTGATQQVPVAEVTITETASGNGNGNGSFLGGDMTPVLIGGGALVLLLVLLMGKR